MPLQALYGLGKDGRMFSEIACFLEETISFKRGKIDSNKEHFIQFTNLFHVPIHYPKESSCEIGKDLKGFYLGMRGIASQVIFGKLDSCLLGKTTRRFGHKKTYQSLIKLPWENGLGVLSVKGTLFENG